MFDALKDYLRGTGRDGFRGRALPLTFALLLALLLPAYACAYTLVFRGGRRVEIPDKFTVTSLTLTYERAPGMNVTVLISAIDVEATERANNEPAGSLLKRATTPAAQGAGSSGAVRRPRKELTQADVEEARRAREKSEQEYERRRVELGLPSREETRRRNEEEVRRMGEEARLARSEGAQAESYWRSRASALRSEMTALDAQILYVNAQLASLPGAQGLAGTTFVRGFPGIGRRVHNVMPFPVVVGHPGFMRAPGQTGAQQAGFQAFGGFDARNLQARVGPFPCVHGGGLRPPRRYLEPTRRPLTGIDIIYPDYFDERAALVSRLRELETARAGLQARWRLLEEEARRAGAPPGWLR